jgi:hypothetical protein
MQDISLPGIRVLVSNCTGKQNLKIVKGHVNVHIWFHFFSSASRLKPYRACTEIQDVSLPEIRVLTSNSQAGGLDEKNRKPKIVKGSVNARLQFHFFSLQAHPYLTVLLSKFRCLSLPETRSVEFSSRQMDTFSSVSNSPHAAQ